MSKMKYLFRKLHIGGGVNGHHQHHRLPPQDRPLTSPQPPQTVPLPPSAASTSSSPRASSLTRAASLESAENSADFNFFEEEFQVQLALAISVSDPDSRDDPEAAQIKAAKQISLGCSPSETLVETLSLRYWSYNFLNYNEKVIDGFYDIYGMTLSSGEQGKIPKLLELQAISVSDNANCEVVVVNHTIDPVLHQLEQRVDAVSMQYQSFEQSQVMSDLIQNIADIVVSQMGGLVTDADDMLTRWNNRSHELRNSMDTIVLPLGCLDIGLSRHRALLFKVLADHINLPCMLVKGSYYTGTDEGAVNLVKLGNGSEYIVDLMGSPGTLVPAELPSDNLQSCGLHISERANYSVEVEDLCPVLRQETASAADPPNSSPVPKEGSSYSVDSLGDKSHSHKEKCNVEDSTKRFENDFGKLFPSLRNSGEDLLSVGVESSEAQKMQVKDVSECVISASKNPEFAQKLHAVLLESGTPRHPDLFPELSPHDIKVMKILENFNLASGEEVYGRAQNYSDALLSNDARLLMSSTGEQSRGAHTDSTHKHPSEGFAKEMPVWNCNAFDMRDLSPRDTKNGDMRDPSPRDTTNGVYVHANRVAEAKNQLNYAPLGIVSAVNPLGMATRTLDGEQAQKSFAPSTANQYKEHPKTALVRDGELFVNDKVGDVLDNVRKEKRSTVRLMERVSGNPRILCNVQNERIDPVLGEVAEWEIPWEDLLIGERIGIGSYGEVYRADWNGTEVAVKKFMDQDLSGDALAQFKCEAEIMLRLRHPNIVLFMGAVARPPNLSILTEYLPRGSLFKLLHRPNVQLDEKRRMRMAIDVAKGMNYLHTCHPIIVHRDLKTPNLLVDKNWNVKVCDFGLSRMKHHTFLSSKSTAGTPEWMAPEVLRNEPSNEKCDVYSFGVILWEFVTLRVPWSDMNSMQVVGAVGFQNRHLDITEEIDPVVAEIIMDCWQRDPQLRPSFGQLISRLKSLERLQRPGGAAQKSQSQSSKQQQR